MPSQLTDNAQSWIIALSVEPKKFFFPNSFSYGVLANRGSTGSGKVSGQVPGQGCGKVPGQVPEEGSGMFQGGSGMFQGGSGQVPRHCFRNRVRGRFWGGSGQGSKEVPGLIREVPVLGQGGSGWVSGGSRQERVGRLDYEECFGQYPVSLEGSDSGSGRVSGNLSFGQGFLAPCNSDVVTARISKHQLASPIIGKRRFFACIVPQTLLGITPGLIIFFFAIGNGLVFKSLITLFSWLVFYEFITNHLAQTRPFKSSMCGRRYFGGRVLLGARQVSGVHQCPGRLPSSQIFRCRRWRNIWELIWLVIGGPVSSYS